MNVLVYCAVAALLFYVVRVMRRKPAFDTRGLKAIPEPSGALPYVGHALQMGASMHLKLHEWRQTFGDIFMVRMGQMNMIILSSDKVVQDLIVKRGALYSGRMRSVTHHNIATRGFSLFLSPYDAYYKRARAIATKVLSPQKIRSYSPKLMHAARQLVRVLLDDPENRAGSTDPREYYRLFPTSIMMDVLGNVHVTGVDDKKFLQYMKFLDDFVEFVAVENSLIEFFPVLKYVPFLNIKKKAIYIRDSAESLLFPVFENVKNDPEKRPCVMRDCLEEGHEDLPTIHLLNNILIGASETVPASMYWLTAILAKHPNAQKHIHEELDRVVGHDRLPTFDDEANLPYLRATIREAQRFRTIVPFGVPHCIEQDDVYEDYHIPKDSLVLINAWSLNLDNQRFKDPERFDPERYLDINTTSAALLHGPCEKRDHYAFGGGRRFCVGVHLAEAELFIFTAHLMWAFRIDLPSDNPNAVDIDNPKQGTTLWPEEYRVHFVPRHEKVSSHLD